MTSAKSRPLKSEGPRGCRAARPTVARYDCQSFLGHPERLVHLAMRVATGDANVTQSCVAQSVKLASRTRPPLPFGNAQFKLIPAGEAREPEGRHCDGTHGWLHIRELDPHTISAVGEGRCDGQHSLTLFVSIW